MDEIFCECPPKDGFYGGFIIREGKAICNTCGRQKGKKPETEKHQLNNLVRPAAPAMYATLYAQMVSFAKKQGYCLALHGSLQRDLDVVAVPWVQEAIPAEDLITKLKAEFGFTDMNDSNGPNKPHGRIAWNLAVEAGMYIDISIVPVIPQVSGSSPVAAVPKHEQHFPPRFCKQCGKEGYKGDWSESFTSCDICWPVNAIPTPGPGKLCGECPDCSGQGTFNVPSAIMKRECPTCHGTGKYPSKPGPDTLAEKRGER